MLFFSMHPERIHFDSLARDYNHHAILAQEAAGILVERLLCFKSLPDRVLDLGCGTGFVTQLLYDLADTMKLDALDVSQKMLAQAPHSARVNLIHGKAQAIPTQDNTYDAVLANLLMPWCSNWPQVFQEVMRVLKPGGLFLLSSLAPDCWLGNEDVISPYACWRDCPSMEQMADALNKTAFEDVVADTLSLAFEFEDGAHVETAFLQSGLLTHKPSQAMQHQHFDINLTLLHAIKPMHARNQGEFYVPVDAIKRTRSD